MIEILPLVLLVSLSGLCLVMLFTAIEAFFPDIIAATRYTSEDAHGRSFLIGLLNFVFLALLMTWLGSLADRLGAGFLGYIAIVFFVLLAIGLTFGVSGMAGYIGLRIWPEDSSWKSTAKGGALLTLACLTPYIGWFGMLPYIAFRGLGAYLITLFERIRRREPAEIA